MRYAFYFDQSKCIGCNACTVSCKDYNQVNPGPVRWRTQRTHETDGENTFYQFSMACNHCLAPACRDACPFGAIVKSADGIVVVDRVKCQGAESECQGACKTACPFDAPKFADDKQEPSMDGEWTTPHPMQKCTFCWERLAKGQKSVCADACPVHALDCGDYSALQEKYPEAVGINTGDFEYAYPNNKNNTQPSFLIKKRKNLVIQKLK